MNKIKERIFEISLVGVGLVLIALVYFLVVGPLGELHTVQGEVEKRTSSLARLAKRPQAPTKEWLEIIEERNQANEAALKEAESFYEAQAKAFRSYFNDSADPPALDLFDSQYKDGTKKLEEDYRTKFKIVPDPAQPENTPPKVSKIEAMEESLIPKAMKEFWMLQEIFTALETLELGGLKEITFAPRGVESKETQPHRRLHSATVKIEMPLGKVENLVTAILASKRVPFILEELTVAKSPELMAPYLTLEKSVDFKEVQEAAKESYDQLVPEPNAVVTLTVAGMEWKGLPAIQAEPLPEESTKS